MVQYLSKKGDKYIVGKAADYFEFSKKRPKDKFLCLMLQDPTAEEVEKLCKDYALDPKPFGKFRDESRSLRYSFNPLTFTFTDYYTEENEIKISHLLFIIKNNLLILVTSDKSQYYNGLFNSVTSRSTSKKNISSGHILYEFLHQDAKENYEVLQSMDDKIELLEQKILDNAHDKNIVPEIISLKKELIEMSKRLWSSSKIIFTIRKDLTEIRLSKEEISLLDDIYDTFIHQIDLIQTHKETITDYLEIYTTNISNRLAGISNELNIVMKKMAALTILIMVPTFIAGVYGMNFTHMPELLWKYGYLIAVVLMALSAFITYKLFHKKGWI